MGTLEEVEAAHAELNLSDCQHMLIIGKQKHYCDCEDEHDEPHHCQCGVEWAND